MDHMEQWIAAIGTAAGSSRGGLPIPPTFKEKPPDSGGFFAYSRPPASRENPNGLLDIAESLC